MKSKVKLSEKNGIKVARADWEMKIAWNQAVVSHR